VQEKEEGKHSERKREILRKIAIDLPEGKTCIKEDILSAMV
jgi:hypothetical protein